MHSWHDHNVHSKCKFNMVDMTHVAIEMVMSFHFYCHALTLTCELNTCIVTCKTNCVNADWILQWYTEVCQFYLMHHLHQLNEDQIFLCSTLKMISKIQFTCNVISQASSGVWQTLKKSCSALKAWNSEIF